MCGLAGFLAPLGRTGGSDETLIQMGSALRHRGPDGSAFWSDSDAGVGLAHRRLAIVDLSDAGLQPMHSHSGRFVLSYNGEIYNHRALRTRLEAEKAVRQPWRGTSDTETFLAAVEAWGVERAIAASVGMFAIALWDRQERRLWLGRDRLGEKPLYYGLQGGVLLFGSELKALRTHPAFQGEIDPVAANAMIRLGYVPQPMSIYRGVFKLPPGSLLTVSVVDGELSSGLPAPVCYWSPTASFSEARQHRLMANDSSKTSDLERLLFDVIGDQMVADVPLGAFLSGGIDSSLIAALMQAQSARPIRTFTIGFSEPEMNEAGAAKAIANHLGTDHTELYVTPQDSLAVIPQLPQVYDEPFADASQVPTLLMCRLARQHVTVALSGDGGDELFGGYNRHILVSGLAGRLMRLPTAARRLIATTLLAVPRARIEGFAGRLQGSGGGVDLVGMARNLEKVVAVLAAPDSTSLYRAFTEQTTPFGPLTLGEAASSRNQEPISETEDCLAQEYMLRDMLSYLPDDVLVKVDRAAMAASLETRAPFLDHRVVEFSHRVGHDQKIRSGKGKVILRSVLARYVPRPLFERPKKGFSVPISTWLRGPLRDWAESLLTTDRLRDAGVFNVPAVRSMWVDHCDGSGNWPAPLWSVLMLQAWLDAQSGTAELIHPERAAALPGYQ